MFLSNLSIKHPVFATMMMAALAVLGIASYSQLKVDLFPKIEIPVVTVTTIYPGAGPETVEREVTKKIEEEINTVEGVRHIESISQEGLSNIVVEFQLEVSAVAASQDVRGKIAAIRGELPARDRGADRPAHRLRGHADPLGRRRRARALAPGRDHLRRQGGQAPDRERARGGLGGPGGRVARARSRWWWTALKLEAYHVSLADVVNGAAARERGRPGRHRRPRRDRGARARGRPRPQRRRHRLDPGQAPGGRRRSTCATWRRSSTASRSRRTPRCSTSSRRSRSTSRSSRAPTPWRWPTA